MKVNKQNRKTNYSAFYILGISLMVLGISLVSTLGSTGIVFLGAGVVFIAIGLANRDKWAESKKEI